MILYTNHLKKLTGILLLLSAVTFFGSCKKSDDTVAPVPDPVPAVGTTWEYQFYTYNSMNGGVITSGTVTYKAKDEKVFGGEKWLNIVNSGPDTTVYLLQKKTDGLYLYANNTSYKLFKKPAVLSETYNSYYNGLTKNFTVKGINDTLTTNIGRKATYFYEGTNAGTLYDQLWYTDDVWLIQTIGYRKFALGTTSYKYSAMYLNSITY